MPTVARGVYVASDQNCGGRPPCPRCPQIALNSTNANQKGDTPPQVSPNKSVGPIRRSEPSHHGCQALDLDHQAANGLSDPFDSAPLGGLDLPLL